MEKLKPTRKTYARTTFFIEATIEDGVHLKFPQHCNEEKSARMSGPSLAIKKLVEERITDEKEIALKLWDFGVTRRKLMSCKKNT